MQDKDEAEALLLDWLPQIEAVIRAACRRYRMEPQEVDEFRSEVFERLIENDYRVLRSFRGGSQPTTFLTQVIRRLLIDYRFRSQGRWRPSTAARQLGTPAVRLETLVHRDGFSAQEALERVWYEARGTVTRGELAEVWLRLPPRLPRLWVGEEVLEPLPAPERSDEPLRQRERQAEMVRVLRSLRAAWRMLAPEEREVLDLRFRQGLRIQQIARRLEREARPLYRLCERGLKRLRRQLVRQRGAQYSAKSSST